MKTVSQDVSHAFAGLCEQGGLAAHPLCSDMAPALLSHQSGSVPCKLMLVWGGDSGCNEQQPAEPHIRAEHSGLASGFCPRAVLAKRQTASNGCTAYRSMHSDWAAAQTKDPSPAVAARLHAVQVPCPALNAALRRMLPCTPSTAGEASKSFFRRHGLQTYGACNVQRRPGHACRYCLPE